MQTHVGYVALALPLLAAGVAWAVGAAVVDRRRRARDPEAPPGPAVVAPDDVAGDAARASPTPTLPTPSLHEPDAGSPPSAAPGRAAVCSALSWCPRPSPS